MKLDKRIIEGKKPLTYFDIEEARHFIGRKGHFSDNVTYFANLNDAGIATLGMVNDSDWNYPFMATGQFSGRARYFLPEEWVQEKEPEPVWKPYDLDSLREDNFTFGREVVMRQKFIAKEPARIYTVVYLGHSENAENLNDVEILLGNTWFSVQRLLDDFEIFDDNYGTIGQPEWRPFGYQE